MIVWLNGNFLDDTTPALPATSAAFLLGWGCYSTLGVREKRPLHLDKHLARLRDNAVRLSIEIAYSNDEIQRALDEVIARNDVASGHARLTLTQRGDGRWNQETGNHFGIMAQSAPSPPLCGLRLMISPFRFDSRRALAGIKSTSYLDYFLAWQGARNAGYDDAVLLNQNGALSETSRTNLFWTRGGELWTPTLECGCLPGIARQLLLEKAPQLGLLVREGTFLPQELRNADEVFITNATNGPRAVESVRFESDERFATGEITQRLQEWWTESSQ